MLIFKTQECNKKSHFMSLGMQISPECTAIVIHSSHENLFLTYYIQGIVLAQRYSNGQHTH